MSVLKEKMVCILQNVANTITQLTRQEMTVENLESAIVWLTDTLGEIHRVTERDDLDLKKQVLRRVEWAIGKVRREIAILERQQSVRTGRPQIDIPIEILSDLVEAGQTNAQIARELKVSLSVVKRRLRQYGIGRRGKFSTLSDEELDSKVRDLIVGDYSLGMRRIQAILLNQGHKLQRQRVNDSLVRVDKEGVARRLPMFSQTLLQLQEPLPAPVNN